MLELGRRDLDLPVAGGVGGAGDHRSQLGPGGGGGGDHGHRSDTPGDNLHQEQDDLGG